MSQEKREDVWLVNKRDRLVCVPAEQADVMTRRGTGTARRATEREVAAYRDRLSRRMRDAAQVREEDKGEAPAGTLLKDVKEVAKTGEGAKVDGASYVVSAEEATLALKAYDTKAKLISLAAAHEMEGVSDKLSLADLKSALLDAVMTGKVPYEAL